MWPRVPFQFDLGEVDDQLFQGEGKLLVLDLKFALEGWFPLDSFG